MKLENWPDLQLIIGTIKVCNHLIMILILIISCHQVNLVKFGILSKISLADAVRGVCKKWLIDNFVINNKIDLIISKITNLETEVANYLQKSIVICPCQVSKINRPNENDIIEISDEIVYNWKRMIKEGGELLERKIDIANIGYKIENNNPAEVLKPIRGKMAIEKEPLTSIEKS